MSEDRPIMDENTLQRQAWEDAALALQEDLGDGDRSALAASADQRGTAMLVCRQNAVLCGSRWFESVFEQLDATMSFEWRCKEGQQMAADTEVVRLSGKVRALLSGERSALNFLQTLSGTATKARAWADRLRAIPDNRTLLLDTRKTLPLLRVAQKYAVAVGGVRNHRLGLWDAVMLKENHIIAAGGIAEAVSQIRDSGAEEKNLPLIVEVEAIGQIEEAIAAGADQLLLDNFTAEQIAAAVGIAKGRCRLEISGNVSEDSLAELARQGADYISVGALTKDVRAVDFSLRLNPED